MRFSTFIPSVLTTIIAAPAAYGKMNVYPDGSFDISTCLTLNEKTRVTAMNFTTPCKEYFVKCSSPKCSIDGVWRAMKGCEVNDWMNHPDMTRCMVIPDMAITRTYGVTKNDVDTSGCQKFFRMSLASSKCLRSRGYALNFTYSYSPPLLYMRLFDDEPTLHSIDGDHCLNVVLMARSLSDKPANAANVEL
ncbi:MAG: hypothetical protein ABW189_04330 [Rickettsiales bacterium]